MASSLLALLDDIATILDDVALLTKVAAQKTTGVLADDLALNAQQVAGVNTERELPVVWAVGKGSMRNKAILVPAALAISALAPWAVIPLLMIGGAFLCFEGFEKLAHRFLHSKAEDSAQNEELLKALADPKVDLVELEKEKIKGAVRTDFILSAEIIAITLGTVAASPFMTKLAVLSGIAVVMTIGVYGVVAMIVKLDDAGLYLHQKAGEGLVPRLQRALGVQILAAAPYLMKGLSIVGTAAMFLVGGGILTHGVPVIGHGIEQIAQQSGAVAGIGGLLEMTVPLVANAGVGIIVGALVLAIVSVAQRLVTRKPASSASSAND